MGKQRMNNKTTQWRQPVGFACGYVVARIEPVGFLSPEDVAYYCVASSGEEGVLFGNELRDRILKNSNNLQERGKYSGDFLNATVMKNGSIRLGTGIPTIKLDSKTSKGSVKNYVSKVRNSTAGKEALAQALAKAEKSWYATHDKVEEKAPAKKSGAINMSVYGGEFKMPADVKKALEEFKKAHPELLTKKAVADARCALVGDGREDESWLDEQWEAVMVNNNAFREALLRCYGTYHLKAYPNDLLCFIRWRQRSTFVSDQTRWLQEGVVVKENYSLARLVASMKIWQYCGDWTDPEYKYGVMTYKFLRETARTKEQLEKTEKVILALAKRPVWWRVALETQIACAIYEQDANGVSYGIKVAEKNVLEDDLFVKHREYMSRCPMGNLQRKAYYPERYKENHPDLPASVPMKNDEE